MVDTLIAVHAQLTQLLCSMYSLGKGLRSEHGRMLAAVFTVSRHGKPFTMISLLGAASSAGRTHQASL